MNKLGQVTKLHKSSKDQREEVNLIREIESLFEGIEPVVYSGDEAQISYDTVLKIRGFDATLPSDEIDKNGLITLQPVTFDPKHKHEFFAALLYTGDFMESNEEIGENGEITKQATVYFVRPHTRHILDELKVPYQVVPFDPEPAEG